MKNRHVHATAVTEHIIGGNLQDWYFIQYGEKPPFHYENKNGQAELQIPYPGNLVTPGQMIVAQMVDESNPFKFKNPVVKGPPRQIDYDSSAIYHDTNRNVYMAKIYGYAGFIRGRLTITPPVVINEDKTEAKILIRGQDIRSIPDPDQIYEIIKYMNLFPTVDRNGMDRNTKEAIEKGEDYIIISQGRSMLTAYQPYVISNIKLDKKVGKIKDDGSIDYKDRETIKEVFQGDDVGIYYEGREGHEGFNIYGQRVPVETVVMGPQMGNNLYIDPDEPTHVKSAINGFLNLRENKLEVVETLIIDSDIDYETGNIEFSGNIEIKGKVATGFSVVTFGNLVIHGIVEAASLFSSNDMELRSGVVSAEGYKIECRGNLKARYIQNAHVHVGQNLEVEDFIYHSRIDCNGEIRATAKSGLVVGGRLTAKKKIEVNIAGNRNGALTELVVGIDQNLDDKIKAKKKDIALLMERKNYINEQLKKNFPPNFIRNPAAYVTKLPEDQKAVAVKLVTQLKKIDEWIVNAQKEYDRMEKLGPTYRFTPEIIVHKQKYPGVKEKVVNAPGQIHSNQ